MVMLKRGIVRHDDEQCLYYYGEKVSEEREMSNFFAHISDALERTFTFREFDEFSHFHNKNSIFWFFESILLYPFH